MSDNSQSNPRVLVAGGGVAGLATAFLIRERGREIGRDVQVTVWEAQDSAGGSTRTDLVDGYVCEWGPNGFLDNEPATFDLIDRLQLRSRLLRADEASAHRFIYHTGKLREVPTKPPAFLKSDILPLFAKLRMAMEIVIPAGRNGHDETVYEFGKRRLGDTFAALLLDPMVSGIFAGNAKDLSLAAVFPKMVAMEKQYGGLFRAMIAMQKEAKRSGKKVGGPAGASSVLYTFQNGMGELTQALSEQLQADLDTNRHLDSVERNGRGWIARSGGESCAADAVVLACPSYAAANIIRLMSPKTAEALRQIHHAPVDVVCHGYAASAFPQPLNGFGVLIPRSEGLRSLGCLWSDSIFPGQAPQQHRLLRTIIGGAHDPHVTELSVDHLDHIAVEDNRRMLALTDAPVFRRIFRHPRGIAQYNVGHLQRLDAVDTMEQGARGIFFTGASYRGVSVNGCIKDANRVADVFWTQQGVRV